MCEALTKNVLPSTLHHRISEILKGTTVDKEGVLSKSFATHSAVYHQKCILRFHPNSIKRKENQELDKSTVVEKANFGPKITRRSFNASNFSKSCFFCDGSDETLIDCRSMSLCAHVKLWAKGLNDSRLLAKLSEGDMVATEAQYHKKCLTNCYNTYKSNQRSALPEAELLRDVERKALKDVVDYIKEKVIICIESECTPVFTQKSLSDLYKQRLICHGAGEDFAKKSHATRLRENVMQKIPGFRESRDGRKVLISMDDDIGKALFIACENSVEEEQRILSKAAKLVRKHILECDDEVFDGDTSDERKSMSVPNSLKCFIAMVLEGGSIDRELSAPLCKITTNIGQIIRFNTVKRKRKETITNFRHSTKNEPPLLVETGLFLHSISRKRKLVDAFAEEGISISYDRVKQMREMVGDQVREEYQENDLVCPPLLEEGAFITAAVDNLDHNPSSVEAESSVHVTTISIFQHVTNSIKISQKAFDFNPKNHNKRRRVALPENYTRIQPTRQGKPEAPQGMQHLNEPSIPPREYASSWIEHLATPPDNGDGNENPVSFSAFFSKDCSDEVVKTSSHLLPIIPETVTSPATIRHAIRQIQKITEKLNPGQPAVITGDQHVYALGKQIQWMFPNEFKDVIWLLGPLHIEQNFLEAIGKRLQGSGWVKIYEYSTIATSGKADAGGAG